MSCWTVAASDLPARLGELEDPPAALQGRGTPLPSGPLVAIVGSRTPSADGLAFARELARDLAQQGVAIVSGGALGIDTAAHRGALDAERPSWAVLVSVERPSPRRNLGLFRELLEAGGGWVAEAGRPAQKSEFLRRNRLVAAFCDALVVVQARIPSGTASTVAVARRLGRPVGAVPWGPYEPVGAGCRRVIEEGGFWVHEARDVLERLGLQAPPAGESRSRAPVSVEAWAAREGVPMQDALRTLSLLELEGRVRIEGGRVRVTGPASPPDRPRGRPARRS